MILSDLIERMITAGMAPGEAGAIAAEIFAAGVASASVRSTGAERQQRYRDRKRNESVTNRNVVTPEPTVTNRNESVTNRNVVTPPLSISNNKKEKRESRATQMPEGWKPDENRWQAACRTFGEDGADRELRKFTSNARAKGLTYKNWNFAWDTWTERAVEWRPKQAAGVGVVNPEAVDWRTVLQSYKNYGKWPKGHGNDPTSPSCRAPPALLREYGFGKNEGPTWHAHDADSRTT